MVFVCTFCIRINSYTGTQSKFKGVYDPDWTGL
jgi:hypothetical protein